MHRNGQDDAAIVDQDGKRDVLKEGEETIKSDGGKSTGNYYCSRNPEKNDGNEQPGEGIVVVQHKQMQTLKSLNFFQRWDLVFSRK